MNLTTKEQKEMYDCIIRMDGKIQSIETKGCQRGIDMFSSLNKKIWAFLLTILAIAFAPYTSAIAAFFK